MLGVGDDYHDLFSGDEEEEYIDSKFTNQQIQVQWDLGSQVNKLTDRRLLKHAEGHTD